MDTFNQGQGQGQGQGQATFWIKHDVARLQNFTVFRRLLFLRNQDCTVEVSFPVFTDLMTRTSTTQDFDNFAFTFKSGRHVLSPGQDLIFRSDRMKIIGKLSSPELNKFDVAIPSVRLTTFKYNFAGIPTHVQYYGFEEKQVFKVAYDWYGSASLRKRLPITLFNTPSATGIFTVYFFLEQKQTSSTDSIVSGFEFKHNYYILKKQGEEVLQRNKVYIDTEHTHISTEFDKYVSIRVPEFSFSAIGNPMPTISLYRACSEVSVEEVGISETRMLSKYEIIHFFRFKNATEAMAGSYNIVARSGQMEAREITSIGVVH